jgi:hypothetical protein
MRSLRDAARLAAVLVALTGVVGCGGGNEPNFASTSGSAPPDAPRTLAEVDARLPKTDLWGSAPSGFPPGALNRFIVLIFVS